MKWKISGKCNTIFMESFGSTLHGFCLFLWPPWLCGRAWLVWKITLLKLKYGLKSFKCNIFSCFFFSVFVFCSQALFPLHARLISWQWKMTTHYLFILMSASFLKWLVYDSITCNSAERYHEVITILYSKTSLARTQRLAQTSHKLKPLGHLHEGVILLLRPEAFSFFFSYLNW